MGSDDHRTLADRTCVVTGASRGIGRGIATEFGRHGATVIVNYRSSEADAYDVVDEIEAMGGTALTAQADVTDVASIKSMRDSIRERVGPVDVLVNNAGITADRTLEKMTHDEWDRVIDVLLGGTFTCTKAFLEDVKHADSGRVINISSVVGKQGNYGQANYAAAKSGLFGFTRTLALELSRSGSTANCVAPGFTRTGMLEDVPADVKDRVREDIPLGRFADVEDVVGIVRFLASDDSAYITGEVIDVNGGIDL